MYNTDVKMTVKCPGCGREYFVTVEDAPVCDDKPLDDYKIEFLTWNHLKVCRAIADAGFQVEDEELMCQWCIADGLDPVGASIG